MLVNNESPKIIKGFIGHDDDDDDDDATTTFFPAADLVEQRFYKNKSYI